MKGIAAIHVLEEVLFKHHGSLIAGVTQLGVLFEPMPLVERVDQGRVRLERLPVVDGDLEDVKLAGIVIARQAGSVISS